MKIEVLVESLKQVGHDTVQLKDSTDAALLVLPYGARILGLFPAGQTNLLWVHPSLGDPKSAAEFFRTPGWRNTGGDRTWISPERDNHIGNLQDPWNTYTVPPSIDPGAFTVAMTDSEVRLNTEGVVTNHRRQRDCAVRLEKTIRMVPNPLRYEPAASDILRGVSYAGFEQITSLSYTDMKSDFRPLLSLWDAVNLPAAGNVIIPTVRKIAPTDFIEPTGASHLRTWDGGASFLFDGRERHKIAVRAMHLPAGRAGYFRKIAGDECSLLIRNFFIDPSAEYVDTPWSDPADRGYVLECYNDGGANGAYGELEYHSPAMGEGTGRTECYDRAQLWGFCGPERHILAIVGMFLGEAVTKAFAQSARP